MWWSTKLARRNDRARQGQRFWPQKNKTYRIAIDGVSAAGSRAQSQEHEHGRALVVVVLACAYALEQQINRI